MKKIFALGICLIGLISCAPSAMKMVGSEEVIGRNYLNGKDIVAKTYTFPERIHAYYVDTFSNCITAELRGAKESGYLKTRGKIAVFDRNAGNSKWVSSVNYNVSNMFLQDTFIIKQFGTHCIRFDYRNGEKVWETSHRIIYSSANHIGLGMKSGWADVVDGIDLSTGKKLFGREVGTDFGINQITSWNDSTILLVAGGLHSFHKKYGYGMDYEAVTGKNDYTRVVAANAAGVASGMLTGVFVVSAGRDAYTGLVSNVLIDSASIYFASREKLTQFANDGQPMWTRLLPKDKMSKSVLFKRDSTVYLINMGIAYYNGRKVEYGKPFLAAFEAKSGESKYINFLGDDKISVNDFQLSGDTVMLVFNDEISKYQLSDGSLIREKIMDPETYGEQLKILGEQNFVKTATGYNSLVKTDEDHHYVFSNDGKVWRMNKQLTVDTQSIKDQLFTKYMSVPSATFIYRDGNTKVLDASGSEIAELSMLISAKKQGNKMYWTKTNVLFELDLNDLKQNKNDAINGQTPSTQN